MKKDKLWFYLFGSLRIARLSDKVHPVVAMCELDTGELFIDDTSVLLYNIQL